MPEVHRLALGVHVRFRTPDDGDVGRVAGSRRVRPGKGRRFRSDASVGVNGLAIPVDQLGIFSTTITLQLGLNTINVIATNPMGDTLQESITITYREP